MAKYDFRSKGLDEFELRYFDKDNQEVVIPFKRTVELASIIQNVDADARFKMYEYLTKNGKSKNDLIVERKGADGSIIVDETNYREFESQFLIKAQYDMAKELYRKLFNMTLEEIVINLNLTEEESFMFGSKVREIIINGLNEDKIPSQIKDESISPKEN